MFGHPNDTQTVTLVGFNVTSIIKGVSVLVFYPAV